MKNIVTVAVCGIWVFGLRVAPGLAQTTPPARPPAAGTAQAGTAASTTPEALTPAALTANLRKAETERNGEQLVVSYGQATVDPQLARTALSLLMLDYYRMRARATTAEQATQAVNEAALRFAVFAAAQNQVQIQQNQVLAQQNDRIIELLEIIATRSATPALPAPTPPRSR